MSLLPHDQARPPSGNASRGKEEDEEDLPLLQWVYEQLQWAPQHVAAQHEQHVAAARSKAGVGPRVPDPISHHPLPRLAAMSYACGALSFLCDARLRVMHIRQELEETW